MLYSEIKRYDIASSTTGMGNSYRQIETEGIDRYRDIGRNTQREREREREREHCG